ncbi:hypothetical protein F5146DRAFT_1229315 [Armillaria mellea]|nr:hypothetical protein F5146DRAFT_1229312 [Armillaria mellea]KAK0183815.1 hypothetical protein F5146DRAFT_1229315 [Armillaria mellea]
MSPRANLPSFGTRDMPLDVDMFDSTAYVVTVAKMMLAGYKRMDPSRGMHHTIPPFPFRPLFILHPLFSSRTILSFISHVELTAAVAVHGLWCVPRLALVDASWSRDRNSVPGWAGFDCRAFFLLLTAMLIGILSSSSMASTDRRWDEMEGIGGRDLYDHAINAHLTVCQLRRLRCHRSYDVELEDHDGAADSAVVREWASARTQGGGGGAIIRRREGMLLLDKKEAEGCATGWKGRQNEGLDDVERVADVDFGGRMQVGASSRRGGGWDQRRYFRRSLTFCIPRKEGRGDASSSRDNNYNACLDFQFGGKPDQNSPISDRSISHAEVNTVAR